MTEDQIITQFPQETFRGEFKRQKSVFRELMCLFNKISISPPLNYCLNITTLFSSYESDIKPLLYSVTWRTE